MKIASKLKLGNIQSIATNDFNYFLKSIFLIESKIQ